MVIAKYFIALKYSVTGFDSENAIKVKGVIGANSLVGAILTAALCIIMLRQHARLLSHNTSHCKRDEA